MNWSWMGTESGIIILLMQKECIFKNCFKIILYYLSLPEVYIIYDGRLLKNLTSE